MPRSVLAAFDSDRTEPARICGMLRRAGDGVTQLTLMWVWRPTRLLGFTPLGGCDTAELTKIYEREAIERFRSSLNEVPDEVYVRALVLQGSFVRNLVRELRAERYDELALGHRLRQRQIARVRRTAPSLKVVSLDRSGRWT
jgi:hypothetical protein